MDRFIKLQDGILDLNTNIVWAFGPFHKYLVTLEVANSNCLQIGNGWRLPSIAEFLSIIDYSQYSPVLPVNHPFKIDRLEGDGWYFWTSSIFGRNQQSNYCISLLSGSVSSAYKTELLHMWMVRSITM